MVEILLITLLVLHLLEIGVLISLALTTAWSSTISVEVLHNTKSDKNSGFDKTYRQAREANRQSDEDESGDSSSDNMESVDPNTRLDNVFERQ